MIFNHSSRFFITLILLIIPFSLSAKKENSFGRHGILMTIRTPQDMIGPKLPDKYRVSVILSGDIASEISQNLTAMKLDAPLFEEIMPVKGRFYLNLANADYALETRELISGILNPVELLDIVVATVVRYRDKQNFPVLVKETSISITPEPNAGSTLVRIELKPWGNRFGYLNEDMGVYVQESWLTRMALVMDTASHLVHQLSQTKISRHYTLDQTSKPVPDTMLSRYTFEYAGVDGLMMPSKLSLAINGREALTVSAGYRREKQYIVFDTRSICYTEQTNPARCLTMNYQAYKFGGILQANKVLAEPTDYTRQLSEAAQLSRKASDELYAGKILSSVRSLQKLIDLYPNTPHAVESKKLLANLPKGL